MARLSGLTVLVLSSFPLRPEAAYKLDWEARGSNFFDDFDFKLDNFNYGAAAYLTQEEAVAAGVVKAFDTHAILQTGKSVGNRSLPKRESAFIQSKKGWKHFLLMVRFDHLPWGCGLWPAMWTLGFGKEWPEGGEIDILEYVNDLPQEVSFHTGHSNQCRLDGELVNAKYGAMPDANGNDYNCVTDYSLAQTGCSPNKLPLLPGEQWSGGGGMLALESTSEFIKVFHIPAAHADIAGEPKPEEWDEWVVSYFPFAESEEKTPGSCPNSKDLLTEQRLIMNINMCGEWGSPTWGLAKTCLNQVGPKFPEQCKIMAPRVQPEGLGEDCCLQFVGDADGEFGADEYFRDHAFFNISWARVYLQEADEDLIVV